MCWHEWEEEEDYWLYNPVTKFKDAYSHNFRGTQVVPVREQALFPGLFHEHFPRQGKSKKNKLYQKSFPATNHNL